MTAATNATTITTKSQRTINKLKQQIEQSTIMPAKQQHQTSAGKNLQDESTTTVATATQFDERCDSSEDLVTPPRPLGRRQNQDEENSRSRPGRRLVEKTARHASHTRNRRKCNTTKLHRTTANLPILRRAIQRVAFHDSCLKELEQTKCETREGRRGLRQVHTNSSHGGPSNRSDEHMKKFLR